MLDLGLPDRDGLDVLRELRAGADARPILILTARDGVEIALPGSTAAQTTTSSSRSP